MRRGANTPETNPSESTTSAEPAYLTRIVFHVEYAYNPKFGDNKMCECGHPYHRHFDSYENMAPVGCKYCECQSFSQK